MCKLVLNTLLKGLKFCRTEVIKFLSLPWPSMQCISHFLMVRMREEKIKNTVLDQPTLLSTNNKNKIKKVTVLVNQSMVGPAVCEQNQNRR